MKSTGSPSALPSPAESHLNHEIDNPRHRLSGFFGDHLLTVEGDGKWLLPRQSCKRTDVSVQTGSAIARLSLSHSRRWALVRRKQNS